MREHYFRLIDHSECLYCRVVTENGNPIKIEPLATMPYRIDEGDPAGSQNNG
jgi:hypothetical protein